MKRKLINLVLCWALVCGPLLPSVAAQWLLVLAGGAPSATEHLWSTPILQQQTTSNDFYNVGTLFVANADQFVQNTDSARLITKVRLYMTETEGSDQTVQMQLRSAVNQGGTLYASATATLHASQTEWVDFTISYTMGASTDFYINVDVTGITGRARINLDNVSGGTGYDSTTYKSYRNGSDDVNFDLCFEIYITS